MSSGSSHDASEAIKEIENNLQEIEKDESIPSDSEHSDYQRHFESHQNSLDSVSDFKYGVHAENHSSIKSEGEHHESAHEEPQHGKKFGYDWKDCLYWRCWLNSEWYDDLLGTSSSYMSLYLIQAIN